MVAAVVCVTIVEIILPTGNFKKYIVFMCGVFLVIVIINPIIGIVNSDIDIEKYLEQNQLVFQDVAYNIDSDYFNDNVEKSYKNNLEKDIITRLEENGYRVLNVDFEIDDKTFEPTQVNLIIEGKDGYVQPVVIDASKNMNDVLTIEQKSDIKKIVVDNYGVLESNIKINE